ncbi:AMP-dependent synthetase and ligase [Oscillochloris trichoides DG-6]|uniref:AMP-dependent synthetase and ligase n=1 Tax=Oscillochloris trichoides DG-6 TaxID=765420 RepID=E1IEU5_9CHLR|nr:acyl-CoA synthetase [Oscillochloris trichoides]EFO80292.1 AMP-dependent synthetase and ligase [Oscillochloris trichoides DG-6]
MHSILAATLAHATHTPQRTCMIWHGQSLSYAALVAAARTWASFYRALGLVQGDRVALYLGNTPAFLAAYLGTHLAGGAAVLINTQYRQIELEHILSDSAPHIAVGDTTTALELRITLGKLRQAGHAITQITSDGSWSGMPVHEHGSLDLPLPQPDDLAILAYTSGTTGRSKGAMLTHANLLANSRAVLEAWQWTEHDRLLLTLPLFHIHGLGVGVHGSLLTGASIDLRPQFEPDSVLLTLASGAVSMFFGVPTMYGRLLQAASGAEYAAIRSAIMQRMRLFVSGSAALPPQIFAQFRDLFGHTILERYGMTETIMNLTNPYHGERRAGTVGMPFPGQEARIVDLHSRATLPDGEVGEIQVRGPHVCAGYWRNPQASAEVFDADGWFSTGDLGRREADGYYVITGRARELIISGGYNIYPREVEERLLSHPAVLECAVRGLPDPDFGEQVAAWIVPSSFPLDAAASNTLSSELIAFCRAGLAAYKRPRQIFFVAALPRNALGKVQKHLLTQYPVP